MDLPTHFMVPSINFLSLSNDTIPANIDPSTISFLSGSSPFSLASFVSNPCSKDKWLDQGEAISLRSLSVPPVQDGDWTTVETVLIRAYRHQSDAFWSFPGILGQDVRQFGDKGRLRCILYRFNKKEIAFKWPINGFYVTYHMPLVPSQ